MTQPIAILGAGPSGLLLARLLELATIDYIVFERDDPKTWAIGRGGTLDVHVSSGQLALQEAGLLDQFNSIARRDATNAIADSNGTVHLLKSTEGDQDRPEIDRKDLRALLLSSISAHKIHWRMRVSHAQRGSDRSMSIHFADGGIESGFRLLVGADGAWSKVRSLVTSARPQYSGVHFLTTTITPGNPFHCAATLLIGKGNYLAVGGGKQLAVQKLGDKSYSIGVGLRIPESWSTDDASLREHPSKLRRLLLDENFADWPQVHTDLIKHSEGEFRVWPLYAMPTKSLSWQTVPGVALIGDAAHLTTPFVGEGVNCALYDSLQLAQQIVKHGLDDLHEAVSEYEKLMFPRAIDLIQKSAMSGEYLFASDAPRGWLKAFTGVEST